MDDRRRTTSDGKSSHCLWQGELKSGLIRHVTSQKRSNSHDIFYGRT